MSDFHRSLDRAMVNARCDYWAITDDPYTSLPRDTGVVDAYDPHTDWGVSGAQIRAIQDKINRDVVALAARSLSPAFFGPEEVESTALEDLVRARTLMQDAPQSWPPRYDIRWEEPVVRPLEFTASIETIELLCGASLIPLCERQIPAEGTE